MSQKKMKQSMAEFNSARPETGLSDADKTVLAKLEEKAPPTVTEKSFSEEVKAQLATVEAVGSENAKLSEENLMLKEKLAEYISEIAKLKSSSSAAKLKELQDENDNYLMKISELTFDNARLTASVNELQRKVDLLQQAEQVQPNMPMAVQQRLPGTNPNSSVYRGGYRDSNGYTAWN